MAQIPMTPGRSRMPGTPNLKLGAGMVTPEDLGSREFNEYGKLAQAIGHAGQAQMGWAINKYNERAEAESRTALSSYMKEMGTLRTQILSTTGSNAFNASKEMEEYSRAKGEALSGTLTTPLAKEMFNRNREGFDRQNYSAATAHTLREQENYRNTSIQANNDALMNDSVVNAGNGVVLAGNIQKIKANNAELYRGMPQEFIGMKNREMASLTAEKVAQAIAVDPQGGPQAALNFLNSGIEAEIGDGDLKVKFDALRIKYKTEVGKVAEKQAVDAGTNAGLAVIDSGGKMRDVYREMIRVYGTEAANKIMSNLDKDQKYAGEEEKAASEAAKAAAKESKDKEGVALKEMARHMIDAGFSPKEVEDRIREVAPAMVETCAAAAKSRFESVKADKTSKELQHESQLDDEFNQAGGKVANMASFGQMTLEEKTAYLKKAEEYEKASSQPDPKPSLDTYLELGKLTDEELNTRWEGKAARDADITAMGGTKSEWSKRQIDRIDALAMAKREARAAAKSASAKPDEWKQLDTELNNIKRDINLNLADTGRNVSDDERKIITDRVLNDYNDKLNAYMASKDLSKQTQIPPEQLKRMRAESLLTYQVTVPGWIWDGAAQMTQAEAAAAGISTENAGIVPTSMPVDLRKNYLGGTVKRIPLAHQDPLIADTGIPVDKAPENVRYAYQTVGANPRIIRDMISGGFLVIGSDRVLDLDSDGQNPVALEQKIADAFRDAITREDTAFSARSDMWAAGHGIQ